MEKIVIDSAVADVFKKTQRIAEICDSSGEVLGRFVPTSPAEVMDSSEMEWDEAELDERAKAKVWYTTEEVLDHLKKLG